MRSLHPAIDPNPSFVLLKQRALVLGALLRSGLSFQHAKALCEKLLYELEERLKFGFPHRIDHWLSRRLKKHQGTKIGLPFVETDVTALIFAVSHPALTSRSRCILCLHVIGGLPYRRIKNPQHYSERWYERLSRALRALSYSLTSDMISYDRSSRNRDEIIL